VLERRAIYVSAALLPLLLGACRAEHTPSPRTALDPASWSPRLTNSVRINKSPAGPVPIFDSENLPILQLEAKSLPQLALKWRGGAHATTAPLRRGAKVMFRMDQAPPNSVAPELVLETNGKELAHCTLTFQPAPSQLSKIVEARRLATTGALQSALEHLSTTAEDPALIRFLHLKERGSLLLAHHDPKGARLAWEAALAEAHGMGSPSEAAGRLRALAYLDLQSGHYRRAVERLQEARVLSEAIGDDLGLARNLHYEGLLLQRRGAPYLPKLARDRYQAAFESAWLRGADEDAGLFAMQLATLLAEHGSYDEANALFEEHCREESLPPEQAAVVLLHRAYADRLALAEDVPGLTLDTVRLRLDAALSAARRAGQPRQVLWARADRFLLEAELGDPAEARRLQVDLTATEPLALEVRRWPVALAAIQLDLRQGRTEGLSKRLDELAEGLRHTEAGEDGDFMVIVMTLRGDLLRRLGDNAGAAEAYEEALELASRLGRSFALPRAQGPYRARRKAASRALLSLLLEQGRTKEALILHEDQRAEILAELIVQASTAQDPAAWSAYEARRWAWRERFPEGCGHNPEDPTCRREAHAIDLALNDLWAQASTLPRPQAPSGSASTTPPPGVAHISVARTLTGWATFLQTHDHLRVHEAVKDPFQGLEHELESHRRLIIAPGESVEAFDLASRPASDGTPLGARIEVMLTPHLSLLEDEPRAGGFHRWLAVIDPTADLPGTHPEAALIRRVHPRAHLLIAAQAERERILASWGEIDAFHFAGHGFTHRRDPWTTHLLLPNGHRLTIEDVLFRPTSAHLVVLNACRTGPLVYRGEVGLPHAFIAAGTDYVLATTADVLDQPAGAFMAAFHRHLEAASVPEAYRRAMAESGLGSSPFRLWTRRK
jgi:predicted negative regulator of RcsB-dependent stress response